MRLLSLSICIILFNQYQLNGQNVLAGIVVDQSSKEPIIFAKVDFPMQNTSIQTEFDAKFELSSSEDSVLAFVQYPGYQLAKKMLKRSQVPDTIKLELGLSIPPASVMGNFDFPTHISKEYIKQEAFAHLYMWWKRHKLYKMECSNLEWFREVDQLKQIDCTYLKFTNDTKSKKCLLFNLYTQEEINPDSEIDLLKLPKGVYELYVSDEDYYWFNTPYINYRSGVRVHEINQPGAIIYNFFD